MGRIVWFGPAAGGAFIGFGGGAALLCGGILLAGVAIGVGAVKAYEHYNK